VWEEFLGKVMKFENIVQAVFVKLTKKRGVCRIDIHVDLFRVKQFCFIYIFLRSLPHLKLPRKHCLPLEHYTAYHLKLLTTCCLPLEEGGIPFSVFTRAQKMQLMYLQTNMK